MRLVIDANIVMSSLIGNGTIFLLIKELSMRGVKLVSPSFLKEEIDEHFDEIMVKSGLDATTLRYLFSELFSLIEIVPKSKYESFIVEAKRICSDKDDIPYLALSLSLDKAPIWSFDKKLKDDCKKAKIKVFSSLEAVVKEMLKRLEK